MGSLTTNYSFNLPTIGGDQNSWGNELNANWSSLDTILHTASSSGSGFLPLTGGSLSGGLAVNGTLQVNGTIGASGLVAFAFPTVSDFYMIRSAPNRQLHWSNSASVNWNESDASVRFVNGSTVTMTVDPSGNLYIAGNGYKSGGGSWAVPSDDRVKRHVEPYRSGLDAVCALLPISFEYNGEGHTVANGSRYVGLSAQRTKAVMPELVSEMPSGYLAVDIGPLTLTLVNAVRELADRVGALEHAA